MRVPVGTVTPEGSRFRARISWMASSGKRQYKDVRYDNELDAASAVREWRTELKLCGTISAGHTEPRAELRTPLDKGRPQRVPHKAYIFVLDPSHPRANVNGYVLEHVRVVMSFGIQLPAGAVIHHVNGNGTDNRPQNLVVCESQNFHNLLHRRAKEYAKRHGIDRREVCDECGEKFARVVMHKTRTHRGIKTGSRLTSRAAAST